MSILISGLMTLGWSLENQLMVCPLTLQLVAAVEVVMDMEIIRISTVIIGTTVSSVTTMVMVAMTAIMINAMVAMVDMEGGVAMAVDTLKEIAPIMGLALVILVKSVARQVTLQSTIGNVIRKIIGVRRNLLASHMDLMG
jgi:hypothetical protein